jgi:hypothetical protein
MIDEGLAMAYDLKMVERFDPKARITQCFKCQRYGHISRHCMNKQKCGYCGGDHTTEECADKSQAPRKSCAACNSGEQHASWSTACQARLRDMQRAKTVRRTMARLYPVPGKESHIPIFSETPAGSMRFTGSTQSSDGFTVVTKKRKFGTPGRPIGSINKAKTIEKGEGTRTLDFTPQISLRKPSDSPASTQLTAESEMEVESTQFD